MVRAVLALVVALSSVGLAVSQAGFPVVAGAIGVRVGVPGAGVELTRAFLPIAVALLFAVLCIRFGIRALRTRCTLAADLGRGGRLLGVTVWAALAWLAVELLYRQFWLGWATVFGNLAVSLVVSALVVASCFAAERLVPWSRAPRAVQPVGLVVVAVVALLTASSAWSHREVVAKAALIPVAVVGFAFVLSGVRRVESGPRGRMLLELALASALLTGPAWGLFA
jgi:hypothetical protein